MAPGGGRWGGSRWPAAPTGEGRGRGLWGLAARRRTRHPRGRRAHLRRRQHLALQQGVPQPLRRESLLGGGARLLLALQHAPQPGALLRVGAAGLARGRRRGGRLRRTGARLCAGNLRPHAGAAEALGARGVGWLSSFRSNLGGAAGRRQRATPGTAQGSMPLWAGLVGTLLAVPYPAGRLQLSSLRSTHRKHRRAAGGSSDVATDPLRTSTSYSRYEMQ